MKVSAAFVVSFDLTDDKGVCIVGKRNGQKIDVINAFADKEARDIYDMIMPKKKGE